MIHVLSVTCPTDDFPFGIEGHGAVVGSAEIIELIAVGVARSSAIGFGVPTSEGVARASEGILCKRLGFIVGSAMIPRSLPDARCSYSYRAHTPVAIG